MKNKCDMTGFKHAWLDITPDIIFASNPPWYSSKTEQCVNCKLTRILKVTHEEH